MKTHFTIDRDQLDGVIAFLRVAEHRSFRVAASHLGISPSAISQIVRNLETRTGVALLTRTTRKVGLTEAGQRFIERARPAVEELLSAFESAQTFGEQVTGLLRLNVPRVVLQFLIEPIIGDFCAEYPGVQVEIFTSNDMINIVEDGFDAGIRLGELVEADMVAVRLSPPFRFVVVGSPDYFARHGRPQRPEDLGGHHCIGYRKSVRGPLYRWEFEHGGREFDVAVNGPVIVNDSNLNVTMAVRGLGLAYTADPLAETHIVHGELERVLEEYCPGSSGMFLYYPSRAQALPKLRAFVKFTRSRVKRLMETAPPQVVLHTQTLEVDSPALGES